MANNQDNQSRGMDPSAAPAGAAGQSVHLKLRLQPTNNSDQPIFSNFTMVQAAPGTAFIDFGFLEPGALSAVVRMQQAGGKAPETINGRLACRIALGPDTAAQLAQQLNDLLRSVRHQPAAGIAATSVEAPMTQQ